MRPLAYLTCHTLLLVALLGTNARSDDRPNIFFFFADDWGRYASCYDPLDGDTANSTFQTPNIDRVAADGVLFRNAFVTAPSCTPCRSSLLSGQYFYRTGRGAILQGAIWDPSIPSYPLLLKDAGYHIGYTYKVWSPGTPVNAPYGADENRYMSAGSRFCQFSQQASKAADPEQGKEELLGEVMANFESFLADRQPGQPFCYWFGPTNTHRKWIRGSGKALWGLDPDALKGRMPDFLPDVPEIREDFCDYLGEALALDAAMGRFLDKLEAMGELDNTLLVVSGDHGIPGFPRGKCNLYDFGTGVALLAQWPDRIPKGRVVDDFVNLMDLAPTFLDAAGEPVPEVMTGRSMLDVLLSDREGQVDPTRRFVVTGRERHVAAANDGLPYPQRAIRTKDFLYVRNFKPDRWPAGKPIGLDGDQATLDYESLTENTMVTHMDMDASPTKAWMVLHRNDPEVRPLFDLGFAKRPGEELYDLRKDWDQIENVADNPEYAEVKQRLSGRLMKVLTETEDPRVTGDGMTFERPPFTDLVPSKPVKKPKAK